MPRYRLAVFAFALCVCQGAGGAVAAATAFEPGAAPPREFCRSPQHGRVIRAGPVNYRTLLASLLPGDTLLLAPGEYPRLEIVNLRGVPGRCISVTGPTGNRRAIIFGESGKRTVDIVASSYVSISNLVIDSRRIPGSDGIKAPGGRGPPPHHIVIEGNLIIGAGATQGTNGISIKIAAWNWAIRRNTIIEAGTGIYLGDSDGTAPFIAGIIEDNLIVNPIGYGMQIKYQTHRPAFPGMPEEPQATIIRNNVFRKDDRPSPDGDRPNLLVGGFPDTGRGSNDIYRIYGNVLVDNPREALFQGSGRVSFHDNILIGGGPAAAVFRDHDMPLKLAQIYRNRIYTKQIGIKFGNPARQSQSLTDNVILAETPVAGFDR